MYHHSSRICVYSHCKDLIDRFTAIVLLLLLFPLLVALTVQVRVRLGAPVFFSQLRPGLHARPFLLIKFRTMTSACDAHGNPLPDADRLTSFGRWLRSTSLDELPSLLNIVRGELSFIGPRPLLLQYLPLYSPQQALRHDVKPGLSGWAQINGRNSISWEEKFRLDVWYVDHQSLFLDLLIILRTIFKAILREGINAPGEQTMPPFTGTHPSE